MLDQEPVTRISFKVPQASSSTHAGVERPPQTFFTREMAPSFITGIDSSVVNEFLTRYIFRCLSPDSRSNPSWQRFLPLFDGQRLALLDVYHPSATFSFSVNTSIPARARVEGYHTSKAMPFQRKLEWPAWIDGGNGGSRNLLRLGAGRGKAAKTLHVGNQEAVKAMVDLPATQHDISSSPDKFCVDAWPVPHGEDMSLFVTLHGQFTERMSFLSNRESELELIILGSLIDQCHQKVFGRLTALSFSHPHPRILGRFSRVNRLFLSTVI